ncbi:MAG: hypothetical protein EON59_13495 [Alphaproteobacteria bacterium]|nr:MAG: hypothetical protein EON59_13495 [Alphaproteobacteria bacterium]
MKTPLAVAIRPDPRLDEDLQQLVRCLFQRRSEGVLVPKVSVAADDWAPQEHECHDNVEVWVRSMPGTKHVYGFLHFAGLGTFNAHSVVEDGERGLCDITPSRASQLYPFVRHAGSPQLFAKAEAIGTLYYDFVR